MNDHLKSFANHLAYSAVESQLIKPNVSYCVQENELHYNPVPDPYNGHEYVDLGLPSGTKWATMNVGANSIIDYGNYYKYGKGADVFQPAQTTYTGTENPLATLADTAIQTWGGSWHMPTKAQINELLANTTYQWVTNYQGSGINGGTFTANGQTLFIPAGGSCDSDGTLIRVNAGASLWSSTPSNKSTMAYYFGFRDGGIGGGDAYRYSGFSVRPVVD